MLIHIWSCAFLVVLVIFEVQSQVCIKRKIVTKIVPETYTKTRRVFFGTVTLNTRIETRTIERYARRIEVVTTKFCCQGYSKEADNIEASVETCKPICNSNCTNGYCKRPGECVCNAGYIQRDDTCVPYCEEECSHGACVAPNTCRCDSGYSLVHGTCQPICMTPCQEANTAKYINISVPFNTTQTYKSSTKSYSTSSSSASYTNRTYLTIPPNINAKNTYKNFESTTTTESNFLTKANYTMDVNTTRMTSTDIPLDNKTDYGSSTTTVTYFGTSIRITGGTQDSDAKLNRTAPELINDRQWMQENGIFVWLPAVVLLIGITVLLVWYRIPKRIINRFKGRSYYIQRFNNVAL